MPWPLSLARDSAIRVQGSRGHLRRLHWLYSHDAQADLRLNHPLNPSP